MNLKDEIRKLIELQEIDSQIYKLQGKKDEVLPVKIEKLKKDFKEISTQFTTAEEKLKSLQLKKKDKEIELGTKETELKKFQAQLYQLKNNKEYQAMIKEIESHKADISVVEENTLIVMEELETAKKECGLQKEALAQKEKVFKDEESNLTGAIKDAEAEIKNLAEKRTAHTAKINKKIISRYEHLLKSCKGLALVPVKGNICGACYMHLNHQTINEIKMLEHLVSCGNCVRILYIPEDIEG